MLPPRLRTAACLGLLAVALGGCGGRSGPSPAAADAFLGAVHTADPAVNQVRSDRALLRLGEAVCAELSSGASFQTVADRLLTSGLPTGDIGALLSAAADDLCPRYRGRVDLGGS